ncbi:MAG TPA: glycine cleavage T C-terminal barrel domain-containing protein [Tepidisphaeraceae bacterium]|nr:glycine cleavage T C-terminal barrel domain-containing protein [Tepidisphaeraceae bacterium]
MASQLTNPLHDLHRQAEADFQNWDQIQIVQTFGEPEAEYAAIRKSCGLMDLPQRGILELTGKDRLPFLNNLLTNQLWDKAARSGLAPGQGVYAFLLNVRGQIVADMNVLEQGDRTWLEMDARLTSPLASVLEKYIFTEQVRLIDRSGELHEIALHGPAAEQVIGQSIPHQLGSVCTRLYNVQVTIWRDDVAAVPGYHLVMLRDEARTVWMNLIAQFGSQSQQGRRTLRPVGWAAFNATRIEAGRPIFGIDFDGAAVQTAAPGAKSDSTAGALPAETGLFERAVSLTKGCYLGQEIVARIHARGQQVARRVVGIRMEADQLPIAGSEIFGGAEQNVVGVITSSTVSPVLSNRAICFGQVKRPYFATGTKLLIPAEGALRSGTVGPLKFL